MHIHTLLLDWSIPATKKTRAKMRAIMKLIRMKVFSKCKWRLRKDRVAIKYNKFKHTKLYTPERNKANESYAQSSY